MELAPSSPRPLLAPVLAASAAGSKGAAGVGAREGGGAPEPSGSEPAGREGGGGALRNGAAPADCLLDGFLVLADAHGAFQEAALELRRHAAEAQAALRRRDQPRLASASRSPGYAVLQVGPPRPAVAHHGRRLRPV